MNPRVSPRRAADVRKAGTTVIGIGVGLDNDDEIRNIVRDDRRLVLVTDHLALMNVAFEVAGLLCKGEPTAERRSHVLVAGCQIVVTGFNYGYVNLRYDVDHTCVEVN